MALVPDIIQKIASSEELVEPETVRQWFPQFTEEEFNKVMAIITIKKSNAPFESFYAFENVVRALNGIIPDTRLLEGAEPKWIWFACEIIQKIRPQMELSHEVIKYIEFLFTDRGIYFLPPYAMESDVEVDMSEYKEVYDKIQEKAEKGPFPLNGDNFLENQALFLLKFKMYQENQKDN